ncbi:hypothetical protein DAPPUDRAFT_330976 [Daphnia pulex]|uniref:Uncharacterized protein n=1 Tax=Daphnia pulex TaxID=6669 RepID=E9HL51_DAPPU|nr:hypothetical protein DAPPUDRAFT_330976 [Daphnia pulex]|eukprot:EFX67546.1 hypothetical protein DAPPUDRAFT_330976 [Daphnia pulex]
MTFAPLVLLDGFKLADVLEDQFKEKFLTLIQVGRFYLQSVSSEDYDTIWTSVEVCLALNNNRGARKSATFMELLPVGTNVAYRDKKGIYPHLKIFTDADNNKVIYPSILICCDDGVVIQVDDRCKDFKIFIRARGRPRAVLVDVIDQPEASSSRARPRAVVADVIAQPLASSSSGRGRPRTLEADVDKHVASSSRGRGRGRGRNVETLPDSMPTIDQPASYSSLGRGSHTAPPVTTTASLKDLISPIVAGITYHGNIVLPNINSESSGLFNQAGGS